MFYFWRSICGKRNYYYLRGDQALPFKRGIFMMPYSAPCIPANRAASRFLDHHKPSTADAGRHPAPASNRAGRRSRPGRYAGTNHTSPSPSTCLDRVAKLSASARSHCHRHHGHGGSLASSGRPIRQAKPAFVLIPYFSVFRTFRGKAETLGKYGSPSRTRTCDRAVNSRLLYQLSYRGSLGSV